MPSRGRGRSAARAVTASPPTAAPRGRYRSRRAIVDAMRALHAEGDLRPTAPRVAERAGVSVRTVWQQFADMETLLVEANRRDFEILRSLTKRIDPDLPLAGRVADFTSQRARILEQMTPTWRAARIHEPFSAELARSRAVTLAKAKAELETVFTPELAELPGKRRQWLLDGLHAISVWSFWESLQDRARPRPRPGRGALPAHVQRAAGRGGVRRRQVRRRSRASPNCNLRSVSGPGHTIEFAQYRATILTLRPS